VLALLGWVLLVGGWPLGRPCLIFWVHGCPLPMQHHAGLLGLASCRRGQAAHDA
jgi:hypothetical protein